MPRPYLTPTYGLGSSSRTGSAILISSPRTKIGSQGRIYAFEKSRGQGKLHLAASNFIQIIKYIAFYFIIYSFYFIVKSIYINA
jgi:hypothetical protein